MFALQSKYSEKAMHFPGDPAVADHLAQTHFCDHAHPTIMQRARAMARTASDATDLVRHVFLFVRDQIVFGGDHWRTTASCTLRKGYGACFNKNLLMISLLRALQIPATLMGNPLRNTFTRPCVGWASVFFSNPFYHCFTRVSVKGRWVDLDPTLDRGTYDVFYKPAGVAWSIDWDGRGDMLLYTESLTGPPRAFTDIDQALNRNLESYFLFRGEPGWLLHAWLRFGNWKMWRKTGRRPDVA